MVRVVTDSTAHLEPGTAEELGISIVPLNIHFGDEILRDGIDITAAEFFRRLDRSPEMPTSSLLREVLSRRSIVNSARLQMKSSLFTSRAN